MRIVWIGFAGMFFSAVSCSDDESSEAKAWHCYSMPSDAPTYCECSFTTEAALAAAGGERPPYSLAPCPEGNYGCCQLERTSGNGGAVDRCSCYLPDDTFHCSDDNPKVSSCPDGVPVAVDGG